MLTEQPHKGQRVAWRGHDGKLYAHATVLRLEGNLCWIQPDDGEAAPFIWRFKDGLNKLAEIVPERTIDTQMLHISNISA